MIQIANIERTRQGIAPLRLDVLRLLDQFGPRLVREIPSGWPITRQHIRVTVESLLADGLVERAAGRADQGPRMVQLTAAGRRVVDQADWDIEPEFGE